MTNGKNDTRKEDFIKKMALWGKAQGEGAVSRPKAAEEGLIAAVEGYLDANDAKEAWGAFQMASASKKGIEYKQEGSFAQQVSKFKHFLVLGALAGKIDPIDVFSRTKDLIIKLAKDDSTRKSMGGSAYDKLVAVARAQCKQPTAALSDDEIIDILMPEKKAQDEEAILKAAAKKLEKVHATYGTAQAEQALSAVNNRLQELALATDEAKAQHAQNTAANASVETDDMSEEAFTEAFATADEFAEVE
jgi:hypothetical protein